MTPFQRLIALTRDAQALRERIQEAEAAMRRHATADTDRIANRLEDAAISLSHTLADLNAARAAEKARRGPRGETPS